MVVLVAGAECIESKKEVLELIGTELSIRNISVKFNTINVGKLDFCTAPRLCPTQQTERDRILHGAAVPPLNVKTTLNVKTAKCEKPNNR